MGTGNTMCTGNTTETGNTVATRNTLDTGNMTRCLSTVVKGMHTIPLLGADAILWS